MIPTNKGHVEAIIRNTDQAMNEIARTVVWLWDNSKRWQSPLRSGGAPGPKGDHSDPTAASAITPERLAQVHPELVKSLADLDRAASVVLELVRTHRPMRDSEVDRTRGNTVAICIICDGPAYPVRSGKCNACYKRWIKAKRPDTTTFRLDYQRVRDQRPVHEHEAHAPQQSVDLRVSTAP